MLGWKGTEVCEATRLNDVTSPNVKSCQGEALMRGFLDKAESVT